MKRYNNYCRLILLLIGAFTLYTPLGAESFRNSSSNTDSRQSQNYRKSSSGVWNLYRTVFQSAPAEKKRADDSQTGQLFYGSRAPEAAYLSQPLTELDSSAKKPSIMTSISAGKTASTPAKLMLDEVPTELTPSSKSGYKYKTPEFYRGIYLTNNTVLSEKRYLPLLKKSREHGLNVLVVDIQDKLPKMEFIKYARENNFYLVARVVVFEGGLEKYPPPIDHVMKIIDLSETAARMGFMEIQLDYIRFADAVKNKKRLKLSLKERYRLIAGILKMTTDRMRPLGVRVGADVFGRIAFNRDDIVGQKLEIFAKYVDTIYPMLYPSHFYGDPRRIKNPYLTIYEGKKNCIERTGGASKIVAYIQGFEMNVKPSGLTLENYIKKQIAAAEDSGGDGYVVWNARNKYNAFFRAVKSHEKQKEVGREVTLRN